MTWQVFKVVFRLRSPMHIGRVKIGNIQRTRPYVTGRVLWGALTERLTRDQAQKDGGPASASGLYQAMGKRVNQELAFTYLYPTVHDDGQIDLWPWDDGFAPRFLSSYASTALAYPQQSADEGTLHEIECLVPHTVGAGDRVYLAGYVFAQPQPGALDWQAALKRLQMGGERGYGWGWVTPVGDPTPWDDQALFGDMVTVEANGAWPVLRVNQEKAVLLAHTLADGAGAGIAGEVEPLLGRVVDPSEGPLGGRFGVRLSDAQICFAPGATVPQDARFSVGPYGVWTRVS
ncbi:MAG: hypothetical protein JXM73_15970 [Anaerolineae bacterium]|nr:hypothetical protein [Anaerolineae bacterium]